MTTVTAAPAAPLDEVMLAMDVVDTLRHRQDLVVRALDESTREQQLIDKLREIYHQQGIEVPDHILKQGVDALAESRFVYTPPKPGFRTALARLYVSRGSWGRPALALIVALVIALGGYFGIYRPWRDGQVEQARIELSETLPARMARLRQTIFEETKVQTAVVEADAILAQGTAAAQEGDRAAAEQAISSLTDLRDLLRQRYTVKIVNREDEQSGFWRIPQINTAATNYYLVVEALDPDGRPLSLPVLSEETGTTQTVDVWGLRVSEDVYRDVAADKRDDGIIQNNTVGVKQEGFLEPSYRIPVLGGTVTDW